MISAIFGAISSTITQMVDAIGSVLTNVVSLIYTTGDNGGLTDFGTLVLMASGVGLVYWGFKVIRGLVKVR